MPDKSCHNEQVFRSVCRGCHGGCGAYLHVVDGQLVKVTPDRESPMSKGWMCVKGLNAPEITNHPDRLTDPLKRSGQRGSGQWQKVTWEQALDEIAKKLNDYRKSLGPESIAIGQGTGRHHYMHVVRFANAIGTPNWYEAGLAQCFIPRITVGNMTYGGFVTPDYYGDVQPKCILFWGHNPVVSGADGELAVCVRRALQGGAIGIAVDPRRSETAQKCQQWLPIRPGTDAALALAMINYIIQQDLYDHDFVNNWTVGFDELKQHVQGFSIEWAADITGIQPQAIIDAARTYATLKPGVLEWGVSIEQNANCLQTVRALAILRALTGNIDTPGGDIIGMQIIQSYPTLREQFPKGMIKKRLGAEEFKLLGGFKAVMPSAHIPALFKAIADGEPYPVKSLLIFGNNPLLTLANTKKIYAALQKLELLVVTDLFMTPSAALADYVLPAAYWPEVNQVIGYPLVAENIVYAQQKVCQIGNCRQDEWIMDELAKRLGLPGCDQDLHDVMNYQLEPLGITYEQLKEQGFVYPPHEYKKYEKKGFRTPSRKVELYCKSLQRIGYDPLPTFSETVQSLLSSSHLQSEYPYILTTGNRRLEYFHSEYRQVGPLRKRRPDPVADIPKTIAEKHGIAQGDWIMISTPQGSIQMKANILEQMNENAISIDHGWWFPEKGGPDYGFLESNANVLTDDGPPYDPAFGSHQFRGFLCRIEKK